MGTERNTEDQGGPRGQGGQIGIDGGNTRHKEDRTESIKEEREGSVEGGRRRTKVDQQG